MADLSPDRRSTGAIPLTPKGVSVFRPGFSLAVARDFVALTVRVTPPPNPSLRELAAVIGEENTRNLVRTFLREFPASLKELTLVDRKHQHRLIHSMKSSTRVVGAHDFSAKLAQLEENLAEPALPNLSPPELQQLTGEFENVAGPLRDFVAP